MTTAIKHRPIPFNGEMVRAILSGTKTQTRRVVKPQPRRMVWRNILSENGKPEIPAGWGWKGPDGCGYDPEPDGLPNEFCPYGVPGDRLWVREAFLPDPPADHDAWDDHDCTFVEFDGSGRKAADVPPSLRAVEHCLYAADWTGEPIKFKPARFMPRWASRLVLEITDVRVQRVQEITEADARAEGVRFSGQWWLGSRHEVKGTPKVFNMPSVAFSDLWDSINAKRGHGWEANPWVWALTFKRVEDRAEVDSRG